MSSVACHVRELLREQETFTTPSIIYPHEIYLLNTPPNSEQTATTMAPTTSIPQDQIILTFTNPSTKPEEVIRFHYDAGQNSSSNLDLGSGTIPPNHVLVNFLMAPINPQDIMVIADKYPVKPKHQHGGQQSIAGYDGVARVVEVASREDGKFRPGDLVIPRVHGLGTWRRWAILSCDSLLRLPDITLPPSPLSSESQSSMDGLVAACSMLRTVFLPAYFLVEDMRMIRPGDWVLLNAGNTCIAQLAAQFADLVKGARVLRVVRDASCLSNDTKDGPIVTLTEEDLRVGILSGSEDAHPSLAPVKKARDEGRVVLALDAVFGKSGEQLAGLLSRGGTYVNYGSLGGAEGVVSLTQKLLFWNDTRFRSFRLSDQLGLRSVAQQEDLLAWFVRLLVEGRLKAPDVVRIKVPTIREEEGEKFENLVRQVLTNAASKTVGAKKHVFDFGIN